MKEKRLNEIKTIAVKRRMVEEVEQYSDYRTDIDFNYLQDIEFIEKHLRLNGSLSVDEGFCFDGDIFC